MPLRAREDDGRAKLLLSRQFPTDVAARRDVRLRSLASRALPDCNPICPPS